jgi:inhibitor of cysteine peptidase
MATGASLKMTDANGNYSFTTLQPAGNYTVTPTLTHYNFAPVSRDFNNLNASETADFSGTRLTYTISGRITDSASAGQAGVSVTLTGGQSASTQTDPAGNYSFAGLPAGSNYTVTPSKTHYSFSPTSRSFDNLSENQTADFTATLLRYDLAGRVVDAVGTSLAGVSVTLSGAQSGTTTTDANGNYLFASLPAGGNYTLTPTKQFYVFNPVNQAFNNLGGNQIANFSGTLLTYSITGRVTEGSAGVAGVSITLGGSQSGSLQTDAAGYFTFNGLPAGGNYTITPTHAFFTFLPVFNSFTSLGQNQTANFNAVRLTYQVSGYARDACLQGISSATLTLSHDGLNVTTQTSASGFYQFTSVQAGFNYSLTPSKSGYSFNPVFANFPSLNASQTANFTGTPPTSTTTVQLTADAYVRAGSNASSNFGLPTQLIDQLASSANNTYETYLTFDVGQLCTVSNVKLRLFGKLNNSGNLPVAAYAVSNTSWTETAITWNNKPATGTQLTTTTINSTNNAWYEWNLTAYVQSEINAGRRIITIALKGTSVTSNQVTFNSRQATSSKPEVSITAP